MSPIIFLIMLLKCDRAIVLDGIVVSERNQEVVGSQICVKKVEGQNRGHDFSSFFFGMTLERSKLRSSSSAKIICARRMLEAYVDAYVPRQLW